MYVTFPYDSSVPPLLIGYVGNSVMAVISVQTLHTHTSKKIISSSQKLMYTRHTILCLWAHVTAGWAQCRQCTVPYRGRGGELSRQQTVCKCIDDLSLYSATVVSVTVFTSVVIFQL